MTLADYIDEDRWRASGLARALGVDRALIYKWARGKRRIPADKCVIIASLTKGVVSCKEMRPDLPWPGV